MIAAFDLGTKNFAFAVKGEHDYKIVKHASFTPDDDILSKGTINRMRKCQIENMLKETYNITVNKDLKKPDLVDLVLSKQPKKPKRKLNKDVGVVMIQLMDTYKDIWDECDIFLIERQYACTVGDVNFQALKLSHYLEAYLKIYYPQKKILNYNATFKTKKLGAVDLKNKRERKRWAIQYARDILKDENLEYFETLKKQDDVADVVCMIESYNL